MAKQTINIGTSENSNNGDPLRTAFTKINENFDELYDSNTLADSPGDFGSTIIPKTDGTYDLGSTTNKWDEVHSNQVYARDWVSINGSRLSVDANGNLNFPGIINATVRTKQDIQGDIFADDSTRVFDSATSVFTGTFVGDLTGSVFADNSSVMIDSVAGKIRGDIESATVNITSTVGDVNIAAADDIDLETTGANADIRLTSSDNIRLFSVSDTSIESNTYVGIFTDAGNSSHNFIFSETGYFEVLADNGGININNELNFNSGGSPTATLKLNSTILEVENTGGFRLKDSGGNTQMEYLNTGTGILNVVGTINGDLTGSVFADDSTLLVDGVNASIPYSVLSGAPSFGNWTFSSNVLSENSTGNAVIQSSTFAGSKLILRTRGPSDQDWVFDQDGDLTLPAGGSLLGGVSYSPSTDAHWTDPNPTTVADALDRLAAAIFAANGGSSI